MFTSAILDHGVAGLPPAGEAGLKSSAIRARNAAVRQQTHLWTLQPAGLNSEAAASIRALQARGDRLQALVERQAALLREMNHRIANSLAIVGSLVRIQMKDVSDVAARQALLDTEHRLAAVMQVHRSLYASVDHARIDLGSYLRGLLADLGRSLLAESNGSRLKLETIPASVATDRLIALGVIVSELVTNALKYAYPIGDAAGEIRVSLRAAPERGALSIAVEDDGIGFASSPSLGDGLGRRIIDAMASSLGGRVWIDPSHHGARVVVEFPL